MKKLRHIVKHVLVIAGFTLALSLCWSAAFLITSFLYPYIGIQPNEFIRQLINSLLGFFIFGLIIFSLGRIFNPQKKQMDFLQSLNNALIQIAKGNFDVMVTLPPSDNEHARGNPFGELAQNIRHMAGELNEMEQMRQEFVSNVSHEIQSPLTSISGFAGALQNGELSLEERKHYLSIIETESRRLSNLSDNLLKLTSLESEHHPFGANSYRLDKQLRNTVLSCEPQWVDKAIEMDVSLDEATLVADEELVSQVWMNVLGNAIKFTPKGGTIGVHLSKRKGEATVQISDTGIGMSEEERLHVFERFYKADKSRNRSSGGNGLGLAIVKKIIDMHNGEIRVKSKKGGGTQVTVTLKNVETSAL